MNNETNWKFLEYFLITFSFQFLSLKIEPEKYKTSWLKLFIRTASNLNAPPFLSFSESWTSFCQKLLLFFYLGKEKCGKVFVFSSCASTYDVVLNYIVSSMPKEEMCGSRITMVKRTSLFAFHTLSIIPFWMHVLPYIKKKIHFYVTEKVAAVALWVLSSK